MAKRFHDFDAAWAEADAETITVRLLGEDWELPAQMPAAFPLTIQRYLAEGRDPNVDLTNGELLGLLRTMVPADIFDAWVGAGLPLSRLGEVITYLMGEYGFRAPDAVDPKVAPTGPETTTFSPLLSNVGASSKLTSPASTGSTFPEPSTPSAGAGS